MKEYAERQSWTQNGVKKLLYTIDHFCEMVFSFASKFKFLDRFQSMSLHWYENLKDDDFLTDDPTDSDMLENVLPYIRDVSYGLSEISYNFCKLKKLILYFLRFRTQLTVQKYYSFVCGMERRMIATIYLYLC